MLGNITHKSDIGSYSYGTGVASTGAGPHAVTRAGETHYVYDANGNNTSSVIDEGDEFYSDLRNIDYTTFDKVKSISKDGYTTTFAYGADRKRYKRTDSVYNGTRTTLYIGGVEKITKTDGSKQVKRTIGGIAIITIEQEETTEYLYKDHLGSIDVITDHTGAIVQEQSFDPWGLRRNAVDWLVLSESVLMASFGVFSDPITTRGYTGHEMADEVGIIHMNGRIYDPRIGRFLQADPFVQEPFNTQSLNRYSYVLNNPLNATDPTGHFVFTLAAIAIAATAEVVTVAYAATLFAAAGFLDAVVAGASLGDALRAGIISGVSAAAFAGLGDYLTTGYGGEFAAGLDATGFSIKVLGHGTIGGITSELQGGTFGHGFASAGFTALAASFNNSKYVGGDGFSKTRVVIGASIGGTASKLTGGKFANGAVTGAFSQALNAEQAEKKLAAEKRSSLNLFKKRSLQDLAVGRANADIPEEFEVFAHGNQTTVFDDRGGVRLPFTEAELADVIRADEAYFEGMTVRLCSCNTGRGAVNFAQGLANELQAIVIAPNRYYHPGIYSLKNQVRGRFGFPSGEWVTFEPNASPGR